MSAQQRPRHALIVRGGWPGHDAVPQSELFAGFLSDSGFTITVSDSLDVYAEAELMDRVGLIVPCWSMGELDEDQLRGLTSAVVAGAGIAGWHGGVVDAFRSHPEFLQMIGGQFVAHPRGLRDYEVQVADDQLDHPIVAGLPATIEVHSEQYWVLSDDYNTVLASTTIPAGNRWDRPITCPAVWTRKWGAGRVFVCTVGHRMEDLQARDIRTLIERGLIWAAG